MSYDVRVSVADWACADGDREIEFLRERPVRFETRIGWGDSEQLRSHFSKCLDPSRPELVTQPHCIWEIRRAFPTRTRHKRSAAREARPLLTGLSAEPDAARNAVLGRLRSHARASSTAVLSPAACSALIRNESGPAAERGQPRSCASRSFL